eukprot:1777927-Lingulodinium_polyedra.AAC.1
MASWAICGPNPCLATRVPTSSARAGPPAWRQASRATSTTGWNGSTCHGGPSAGGVGGAERPR